MKILDRYKKKEMEGFKEYVMNMEVLPRKKRSEKFLLAALEDPIYMVWVAKNILEVEHILSFHPQNFEFICGQIKGAMKTLALAFYRHHLQSTLLRILPVSFREDYDFEMSLIKAEEFDPAHQEAAQFSLIHLVRTLQKRNEIHEHPWRLPDLHIAKYSKSSYPNGPYELRFEEGALAIRGEMKNSQRTGPWEHFYTSGKLMAKGKYEKDEKVGTWQVFYPDGNIKAEGEFKGNQKVGTWNEWDRRGNMSQVEQKAN